MSYMLDTDTCIYIIKENPPTVINALKSHAINDICISAITLAELNYGVEKSRLVEKNRMALLNFLAPFEILPFTSSASVSYGKIRAFLEKNGQTIGPYDMLIAAHALSESMSLVTNNTKEFMRIPDLSIFNWTE